MTGAESRPNKAYYENDAQRLRLDRDREASRDLNRLLNKPGSVSLETAFCGQPGKRAGGPAALPDGAGFGA